MSQRQKYLKEHLVEMIVFLMVHIPVKSGLIVSWEEDLI